VKNRDLGDGFGTAFGGFRLFEACPVDSESLWLGRYEFLKFLSYFVDFSEARDLFVIIFGFWAELKDQGLQVDFRQVEGPK
jgi:hypothetical protein